MIPTETMGSVGRTADVWAAAGVSPGAQTYVPSEHRRDGGRFLSAITRAGRAKPKAAQRGEREEARDTASIPTRVVNRVKAAMAMMGTGLATSTAGLGWDYYVHEVARDVAAVESMFAAPHLLIFAGFAITGLGFLAALVSARSLLPSLARQASRKVGAG